MTIDGHEVRDSNGEAAKLEVVASSLVLHFAGEVWRSRHADCDHIHWVGDGGLWTRATAQPLEERPPFGPHWGDRPPAAYGPPWEDPRGARCGAPCGSAPWLQSQGLHTQVQTQGETQWMGPGPGSGPPGQSWTAQGSWPGQGFGPPPLQQPVAWPSVGPAMQPPPHGLQLAATSHLPMLEAKVDYLTNAISSLQGEFARMMQVRRNGAQRRAMSDTMSAAGTVAALSDPFAGPLGPPPRGEALSCSGPWMCPQVAMLQRPWQMQPSREGERQSHVAASAKASIAFRPG